MGLKQHVTVPTHISGHTLDLLISMILSSVALLWLTDISQIMRLCYAL